MRTITTKYLGPTTHNGTRIVANDGEHRLTVSRNYANDVEADYLEACRQLKARNGWKGAMIGGHTKDGMVFVFANDEYKVD